MIHSGNEAKEFFVWVDPNDWMVKHNIGMVGGLGHAPPPQEDAAPEHLLFVHNPNHRQGMASRFHIGVIKAYAVEYDLERFRYERFRESPSRLHAMYLFETRQGAQRYRDTPLEHVSTRILKRGVTEGPYVYSLHDLNWIDFLRLGHSMDVNSLNYVWRAYWGGERVSDHQLQSMGEPWTAQPIMEALFYGRVNFPSKSLASSD
jgi:hypothetical protein